MGFAKTDIAGCSAIFGRWAYGAHLFSRLRQVRNVHSILLLFRAKLYQRASANSLAHAVARAGLGCFSPNGVAQPVFSISVRRA